MKFTQPVSMQIPSKEDFERDLKEPLEKLGYNTKWVVYGCKDRILLVSNFDDIHMDLANINFDRRFKSNRHFIDHYNPQLFIALASMTDEPNGIVGEYWVSNGLFTPLHIFKSCYTKDQSMLGEYNEKDGSLYCIIPTSYTRKATKEELIAHFSKKECKEQCLTEKLGLPEFKGTTEVNKSYAEISLRINGVLTRFIAEKEYQSMIDTYESRIKELEEKLGKQNVQIVKHLARVSKIKEICND